MKRAGGSFRDPSGVVFENGGDIYRTINTCYRGQWESLLKNGLFDFLTNAEMMVPFKETAEPFPNAGQAHTIYKWVKPKKIPFISYPYEWSFSQLKDAALLTLAIQKVSLEHTMTTKDASAYNVQFEGSKPLFIDLLSFDHYNEGDTWQAYRQFSMHFLAPLALYQYNFNFGVLSKLWIDGVPLSVASAILPWTSRLSLGMQMHIYTQARLEKKHADGRLAKRKIDATKISKNSLLAIIESLESTVQSLKLKKVDTEWGEYYNDTNYTSVAESEKEKIVADMASQCAAKGKKALAIDLGANNGKYSALLAEHYDYVVAADIDPVAVDNHYNHLKKTDNRRILPLLIDLANPSPGLGWMCKERESFPSRCKADFVSALALIHHLRFTAGIPFGLMAEFFAEYLLSGGYLLVEFVPREDSQVERLLAARDDIFEDYTLEAFCSSFEEKFDKESIVPVLESSRSLVLLRKK